MGEQGEPESCQPACMASLESPAHLVAIDSAQHALAVVLALCVLSLVRVPAVQDEVAFAMHQVEAPLAVVLSERGAREVVDRTRSGQHATPVLLVAEPLADVLGSISGRVLARARARTSRPATRIL